MILWKIQSYIDTVVCKYSGFSTKQQKRAAAVAIDVIWVSSYTICRHILEIFVKKKMIPRFQKGVAKNQRNCQSLYIFQLGITLHEFQSNWKGDIIASCITQNYSISLNSVKHIEQNVLFAFIFLLEPLDDARKNNSNILK